jgi:hypothetical protein
MWNSRHRLSTGAVVLTLFETVPLGVTFTLAPKLRALADRKIYFGTSSWKYDGWLGSIYSQDRYLTRGKFSNAKFGQDCLSEYAEVFPTVCGELFQRLLAIGQRVMLHVLVGIDHLASSRRAGYSSTGKAARDIASAWDRRNNGGAWSGVRP